jgi:hypothetical protein
MADFIADDLYTKPLHVGPFGNAVSSDGKVTPTAAGAADTLKPLRIPGGVRIDELIINADDLDSNGSPTLALDIGYTPVDGVSPAAALTYFATADVVAQAGGLLFCKFDPITFERDVDIIITVDTASATFQAGDIVAVAKGQNIGVKG